jgi:hypothetical protein
MRVLPVPARVISTLWFPLCGSANPHNSTRTSALPVKFCAPMKVAATLSYVTVATFSKLAPGVAMRMETPMTIYLLAPLAVLCA